MGKMAYILAPNAFQSCFFVINSCNLRYYNIKKPWKLEYFENFGESEQIRVDFTKKIGYANFKWLYLENTFFPKAFAVGVL